MPYDTIKLRSPVVAIESVEDVRAATVLRAYPVNQKSGIDWLRVEVELRPKAPSTAGE